METTLVKGLRMLEAVAASAGPRGVSDLARELAITRSNAHRLLQTLCALGYVRHDPPRGQYTATLRLFELGSGIVRRLDVGAVAQPIVEALALEVDENVGLSVRDGSEVVVLARVEGTRTLRTYTPPGSRSPMHPTSPGKLLLAFASVDVVDMAARKLTRFTPRTIVSRRRLDVELAKIRARGYATAHSEWHEDIGGVSAPVRNSNGAVAAALTISGPAVRFTAAQIKAYLPQLLSATQQIGARLGYRGTARAS
jgi:DNA-binding IclR family transcriptional regulator